MEYKKVFWINLILSLLSIALFVFYLAYFLPEMIGINVLYLPFDDPNNTYQRRFVIDFILGLGLLLTLLPLNILQWKKITIYRTTKQEKLEEKINKYKKEIETLDNSL